MFKDKILIQVFKIVLAISISYSVCWLLSTFSSFITYNYLMKKYLKTWSIYEGFADNFFIYFACVVSFYALNLKKNKITFIQIICFVVSFLMIDFGIDLYEHYQSFCQYSTINGPFSYEIAERKFLYRFDIFHSRYYFLSFLVYDFCRILTIVIISVLSVWVKNKIDRFFVSVNS